MTNAQEETKKCSICKEDKVLSEFYNATRNKDGKRSECKKCQSEQTKIRRQKKAQIITMPGANIIIPQKKFVIQKHSYPRVKQGKPLVSIYELLNQTYFSKWIAANSSNQLTIDSLNNIRLNLLGSRDGWHPREFHAAQSIGAFHNPEKDGPDAYFGKGIPVELKINWTNSPDNKLRATGSFNDYNEKRFIRLINTGYILVSALYVGNRLIAAIQLPLHWTPFKDKLESQLKKSNRVCLNFSASDWMGAPDSDVKFLIKPSLTDLFLHQQYIGVTLFEYILRRLDNDITGKTSRDIF